MRFSSAARPSATIGAAVPDTIPPGPTALVGADGHDKFIRIEFKPNPEPDVAGYQIYRGICDHGYVYVPGIVRKPDGRPEHHDDRYRCDMTLVGDVPLGDANAMLAADGIISFDDHSVPAGSPVCYAYWVRAYDFAGNLLRRRRARLSGQATSIAVRRCARRRLLRCRSSRGSERVTTVCSSSGSRRPRRTCARFTSTDPSSSPVLRSSSRACSPTARCFQCRGSAGCRRARRSRPCPIH